MMHTVAASPENACAFALAGAHHVAARCTPDGEGLRTICAQSAHSGLTVLWGVAALPCRSPTLPRCQPGAPDGGSESVWQGNRGRSETASRRWTEAIAGYLDTLRLLHYAPATLPIGNQVGRPIAAPSQGFSPTVREMSVSGQRGTAPDARRTIYPGPESGCIRPRILARRV